MAERTTKGAESQSLDPELVSQLRAELDRARAERSELNAARAEIEPTYDEVTSRMSDLEDREEALYPHIEALEVLLDERPFYRSGKRPGAHRKRRLRQPSPLERQMASANAVVALLEEGGEPLHYRDIHRKLEERGHLGVGGVDPAATLLSRFFKDPRLYRPRPGTYALVEWLDREDEQPADDHPDAADRHAPPRIRIPASRLFLTHDGFKSQLLPDHNVLGAAEQALRAEGSPMHHLALTEKMIELGRWKPIESTPKNVVSLRLAKDIREHGDRSRFRRFGRGIYGLSEWDGNE